MFFIAVASSRISAAVLASTSAGSKRTASASNSSRTRPNMVKVYRTPVRPSRGTHRESPAILGLLHRWTAEILETPMTAETASMEPEVLEAIDAIRPALQADGGDIVFNSIDGDG